MSRWFQGDCLREWLREEIWRRQRGRTMKGRRTSGGSKAGLQSQCLALAHQSPPLPSVPSPSLSSLPSGGANHRSTCFTGVLWGPKGKCLLSTEHNAQGRKHPEKSAVIHLSEKWPQKGMPYTRDLHIFWCQEGSFTLTVLSAPKNFLYLSGDIYHIINENSIFKNVY